LGIYVTSDMKWNTHIDKICAKAFLRLYFLKQLKWTGLAADQLRHFYLLAIRPYCSVVCHHGLKQNTGWTAWGRKRRTIRVISEVTSNMPYQSAMACIVVLVFVRCILYCVFCVFES